MLAAVLIITGTRFAPLGGIEFAYSLRNLIALGGILYILSAIVRPFEEE